LRVIFVGQNPGQPGTRKSPSILRLDEWVRRMGLGFYSFINVIPTPGKVGMKMVEWEFVREACERYPAVIAVGAFPSKVLQRLGINHFRLPHPSGLNRFLNDKIMVSVLVSDCRSYIERANAENPHHRDEQEPVHSGLLQDPGAPGCSESLLSDPVSGRHGVDGGAEGG
jgi:hypothetical protein